jgi:hypothetical protein
MGFLTSGEYLARNASDSAFVASLYVDILGRTPDPSGQAHWQHLLANGHRRDEVALAILTSGEAYLRLLDRYYADFLDRGADVGGQQHWLDALVSRRYDYESAALGFVVSGEFAARQRVRLGA